MSTPVTYTGNQYNVPAYQDTGYAQGTGNLSSYLIALATGSLTTSGGAFPLTADANFGASFGLVSIYYKSRSSNVSSTGTLRLANTDVIGWRDNANANNITVAMNATQTGGAVYTIPDTGSTTANFVMTAGAQTIAGAKTFSSPLLGPAGTVSLPSFSFAGDLDTGTFNGAANEFDIATGGAIAVAITTAKIRGLLPFAAADGTAGAPSFTFNSDLDTGFYSFSPNNIGIAVGGTSVMKIDSLGNMLVSNGLVGGPSFSFLGDPDTGIFSPGANELGIVTGGTQRIDISPTGNIVIGAGALATNATDGFLYITSSAGAPTGVPTAFSGRPPIHYDTTNNKFYVYNGAWKSVTLT